MNIIFATLLHLCWKRILKHNTNPATQGGKNRRRGKNENDNDKRELTFKEEGQGTLHPVELTSIITTNMPLRVCPGPEDVG